jgi:hypothetical protein
VVGEDLPIGQGVTQRIGRRLGRIRRRLAHASMARADARMQATQGEQGRSNPASIERLNATRRTWMPPLVRRTRTPSGAREQLEAGVCWTGCGSNVGHVPAPLAGTPALAADLTDQVGSMAELIRSRCRRE